MIQGVVVSSVGVVVHGVVVSGVELWIMVL